MALGDWPGLAPAGLYGWSHMLYKNRAAHIYQTSPHLQYLHPSDAQQITSIQRHTHTPLNHLAITTVRL